jgi:hypothetical protein
VKKWFVIGGLWLTILAEGWAQPTQERLAFTNLQRSKWTKAKAQIEKALRKDSVNALGHYVFSLYYFSPGNPEFSIDSAYRHALLSLADFPLASSRQRERLRRFPVDSARIARHREKLDSAAFQRAKAINTEQSYIDFITRFPLAAQRSLAVELRDEVAYLDALRENSYQGFKAYLEKYPASARAGEANARYQKLIYEAKTSDKRLASYENFLKEYPETPYRREVEQQVFEIATAPGNRKVFENFLRTYPNSVFASKARNILYYLFKEQDEVIPQWLLTDSIRQAARMEQSYLVPFYRDDKLGFMDQEGREVVAPFATSLSNDYLCGNVTKDVLITPTRVVARNGKMLFEGSVEDAEELGWGYLAVKSGGCYTVVHKSGFTLDAGCLAEANVVGNGRLLALKENNFWKVTTLTGRLLVAATDEVLDFGEVLAVKSGNTFRLCRVDELSKAADQQTPAFGPAVNEVKRWKDALWVRVGDHQGLLDFTLREIVPVQNQEITPAFFGGLVSTPTGTRIWQKGKPVSPPYARVNVSEPWIAVEQNKKWFVFDNLLGLADGRAYDTLFFAGPTLAGGYADSLVVYFEPLNTLVLPRTARVSFLPGKDSLFFIQVEGGAIKTVYNSKGKKLFSTDFERVSYAGENFFTVVKNEKRGILSGEGKLLLAAEFDGVGSLNQGTLPVLKDRKFGMVELNLKKQIKPDYEKNLIRYNASYLIASKGNAKGLIGWDNKPVIPFEYEEIRYWNDSTALVKKDFQWMLYNFIEKKRLVDRIRDFNWIHDADDEKILIIRQDNYYGVIHNRKGYILPATYTDIINLGSITRPLYFTEKYVEEASIYVVIYYDSQGRLLRRQVFEADDYDKIYCSHN